jgi:hypothetical protein
MEIAFFSNRRTRKKIATNVPTNTECSRERIQFHLYLYMHLYVNETKLWALCWHFICILLSDITHTRVFEYMVSFFLLPGVATPIFNKQPCVWILVYQFQYVYIHILRYSKSYYVKKVSKGHTFLIYCYNTIILIYKISLATYFVYTCKLDIYATLDDPVWSHILYTYASSGHIHPKSRDTNMIVATPRIKKKFTYIEVLFYSWLYRTTFELQ